MSLRPGMKNVVDIQGTLCLPIRIFFVKEGPSKYMSHLDLMRCMTRTMRRAGVPIWYTEGFNPHPFMTFALPLALGASGLCETMDVRLTADMPFDEVKKRLNSALCEGIRVTCVEYQGEKATAIQSAVYRITLAADGVSGEELSGALEKYLSQDKILVQKKNKKKQFVDIDVKPHIFSYEVVCDGECAVLSIQLPAGNDVNINPSVLLKGFANANGVEFEKCDIVREKILTADGEEFK